jgi:hypothetical protein
MKSIIRLWEVEARFATRRDCLKGRGAGGGQPGCVALIIVAEQFNARRPLPVTRSPTLPLPTFSDLAGGAAPAGVAAAQLRLFDGFLTAWVSAGSAGPSPPPMRSLLFTILPNGWRMTHI